MEVDGSGRLPAVGSRGTARSPSPRPLPRERGPHRPCWPELGALRLVARRSAILPLPKGEGRGEGEGGRLHYAQPPDGV